MVPAISPPGFRDALQTHVESSELDLPLLPDSATQVLALCFDDDARIERIAEIVQLDPALAANVLHAANSAAYAPRSPIVTLAQAVTRLGLSTLCDVALSVALRGRVFAGAGHAELLQPLWKHSAVSALWAREIARHRRRNVEGAFLVGLLHDVGKPVVLEAASQLARERDAAFGNEEAVAWMDELHASVGERLLTAWELPEWLVASTRYHHEPEAAEEHREEAATACLADLIAHWSVDGDAEHGETLAAHPVLEDLGVYPEDLEALFSKRDAVNEGAQIFF